MAIPSGVYLVCLDPTGVSTILHHQSGCRARDRAERMSRGISFGDKRIAFDSFHAGASCVQTVAPNIVVIPMNISQLERESHGRG